MTEALFLAPHYDDVALSCGGTVALLTSVGIRATMVTVFGGEIPDDAFSAFARQKHARWNLVGLDEVVRQRREENEAASEILGCGHRNLGFPDAIYRADRYTSDEQVYSGVFVEAELALIELVALEIRSLPEFGPDPTVFVPLGIGSHVDHCIVHAVGQRLADEGVSVWAYEDCPYAIHSPAKKASRLSQLGDSLGPPEIVPILDTLSRRLEATAAYATQVRHLFRFTDDFRRSIADHALEVGGASGVAERFWPLRPRATLPP